MNILANILGALAIITWAISVQNKDKKKILIFQMNANIFYSLQYLFLNASTAFIMNFISAIRCLIFYYEDKKKGKISNKSLILFALISILVGVITYNGLFNLIPIICTLIYMYSTWQNNLNLTRYLFIIAAILLIYHNFKVGAYISIIGNIVDIISATISIFRFRKKSIL